MTSSLTQGDASDSMQINHSVKQLRFISRAFVSSCITLATLPMSFTCSAKRPENQPWKGHVKGQHGSTDSSTAACSPFHPHRPASAEKSYSTLR